MCELLILLAFIMGYLIKVPVHHYIFDKFLIIAVMTILLVIGYGFGVDSNHLLHDLSAVMKIIVVFTLMLLLFNCITIGFLCYFTGKNLPPQDSQPTTARGYHYLLYSVIESSKYLLVVISGVFLGHIVRVPLSHMDWIINAILMIILFMIGVQLRGQNISLLSILTNRIGILIAAIIVVSSIFAGFCSALIVNLSPKIGMVLSAGFGWYSLSAMLTGELINHQFGIVAFFIDFFREMVAIMLLPTLGRISPFSVIGYSGATAVDFTLPIIKVNLGEAALPTAMTSGMILTLLVPILIPLLYQL